MASVATNLKAASKVLVGALGFILGVLNENFDLVPDQYKPYVTTAIGIATALGIFHAPYAPIVSKRRSAGQPEGNTVVPGLHPHPGQHEKP